MFKQVDQLVSSHWHETQDVSILSSHVAGRIRSVVVHRRLGTGQNVANSSAVSQYTNISPVSKLASFFNNETMQG